MKLLTAEQMRELDRRTIEEYGTPGAVLMDRAGSCVADIVQRITDSSGLTDPVIQLLAGRGNNGGDAFAAARHLYERGEQVGVCLAGSEDQIRGDARTHLEHMQSAGIALLELATLDDWKAAKESMPPGDIIVDGLLGIGVQGPARGPVAGAISYIRSYADSSLVVAIDVPSGMDADSGRVEGEAVQADVTVTMGLPKSGLIESAAQEYVGDLEVADIGFPDEYVDQIPADPERVVIHESDLYPLFERRKRGSHKGNYGHVLIVGGSRHYSGAVALAARAAIRSGAGLVTAWVPESIVPIVAATAPEIIVRGAPETETGSLSADLWAQWKDELASYSAALIGPGMTRHADTQKVTERFLAAAPIPLVLDADAISVLAGEAGLLKSAKASLVLTPHPGEFAALFGKTVADVQADRVHHALNAAGTLNAVMVLKGSRTVVAGPEPPAHINLSGNPGMATGGTGDVLAGMLVSLIGQGFSPLDAARAAVALHGRVGDHMAWRKSQAGLIASDLIEELPYAFRAVSMR